jgi:hypothetical protein
MFITSGFRIMGFWQYLSNIYTTNIHIYFYDIPNIEVKPFQVLASNADEGMGLAPISIVLVIHFLFALHVVLGF